MKDDINNPSLLNLTGTDFIKFTERQPYVDLSSGNINTQHDIVADQDKNLVKTIKKSELPLDNILLKFSLVEAGTSSVVLQDIITDTNGSIEYIGNGEYRVYIDKKIKQGLVRNSSPGYFVVERNNNDKIDQRGVKVGYNSNINYTKIDYISSERVEIDALHCWCSKDNFVTIVTKQKHGLKYNSVVELFDSKLAGEYKVIDCSENTFTIYKENVTPESKFDCPKFFSFTGTKVYCNVEKLEVGDKVVFDYNSGKGNAHTINTIKRDSIGVYFHVDEVIGQNASKFIVSNTVNDDNTIEFGYESHLSYYNVAKVNPRNSKLWLTYKPDAIIGGRKNQTLSYIQFYSSSLVKNGI